MQMLALTGQGRLDQLPAGDLGYMKLVGRLRGGDPRARATEEEVERSSLPTSLEGAGRAARAAGRPGGAGRARGWRRELALSPVAQ